MANATDETILEENSTLPKLVAPQADDWKFKISYVTVVIFGYLHLSALYGLYLCFTSAHWATIVFDFVLLEVGIIGITAGAHRLWAHRGYKAKLPLQILLMIFQSISNQYTVLNWARDHRLHHRYSDTDADPHNATRGFFFSHVGWLLVQKHPEANKRGAYTDLSDLLNNPVLKFQKKYKFSVIITATYILPTICPMYFWGETFNNAWHVNILRYILGLNIISLVNSACHAFGNKPYDKEIKATENMTTALAALGEGFHNYHHTFPWDYRAAELAVSMFNLTTAFIDFFAWVGWAYELKTVERGTIIRRAKNCGDGTYLCAEANDDIIKKD